MVVVIVYTTVFGIAWEGSVMSMVGYIFSVLGTFRSGGESMSDRRPLRDADSDPMTPPLKTPR
jgi:hypothetical protein